MASLALAAVLLLAVSGYEFAAIHSLRNQLEQLQAQSQAQESHLAALSAATQLGGQPEALLSRFMVSWIHRQGWETVLFLSPGLQRVWMPALARAHWRIGPAEPWVDRFQVEGVSQQGDVSTFQVRVDLASAKSIQDGYQLTVRIQKLAGNRLQVVGLKGDAAAQKALPGLPLS